MSNAHVTSPLRSQSPDFFRQALWVSVALHGFLLLSFVLKSLVFPGEPLIYESAVRVDLVALPDKVINESKVEKKTLAPAPVNLPPAPVPVVEKSATAAIDLPQNTKKMENAAFKKLKELAALEKIQKSLEAESRLQEAAKTFKGNQLSNGSELKGLSRLEHDNYISDVKKQIYRNWALPEWLAQKELKAQALARFDSRGYLVFSKIVKSSGHPDYDRIILETLQKSSPVPAPPDNLAKIIDNEGVLIGFPE